MSNQLKSMRNPDEGPTVVEVGHARFGDGSYPVIAGPSAIVGGEELLDIALAVRDGGAKLLRGSGWITSSSPYGPKGVGAAGVELLAAAGAEAGLATVTEVRDADEAEAAARHIDMLEVGPQNMQNYPLLSALGAMEQPVLLMRGPSATIDEWLMSAEYILAGGNGQVVLVERGIRTFETRTRHTLDISAVPVLRRLSHLPVVVDPGDTGSVDLLTPLALAGQAVGADGLIVEVGPKSHEAAAAGLSVEQYLALMDALGVGRLRREIDLIDRDIVRLLNARLETAVEIGLLKHSRGIPLRSPDREESLLSDVADEAARLGMDPEVIMGLFEQIVAHARAEQRRAVGD